MTVLPLAEYFEVDTADPTFTPKPGDVVFHQRSGKIEMVISPHTDLAQTEFYPLIADSGCVVLRRPRADCDRSLTV